MAYHFKARSTTPGDPAWKQAAIATVADYPALGSVTSTTTFANGSLVGTLIMSLYALISGIVSAANVRFGTARYSGGSTGTAYIPTAANVLLGVNVDATTGTFDEAARNTDPTEAKVETGTSYKIANVAKNGSYPTSATSEAAGAAAQLVTDVAAVTAKKTKIEEGTTILGVFGELTAEVSYNEGYSDGETSQLAKDVAAVRAKRRHIESTQSILGVFGTLLMNLWTRISGLPGVGEVFDTEGAQTFSFTTDAIDFGYRGLKFIRSLNFGLNNVTDLYVSIGARYKSNDEWKQFPVVPVNTEGFAFVNVTGNEFRISATGTVGANGKIEYIKLRWSACDNRDTRGLYEPNQAGPDAN